MPLIDPATVNNPTAGQPATAAWGDAVRDAAVYLGTGKPHCRVYNNANFSVGSSATWTSITFNTERFDVGAMHSTASNQSRIVVPTGEGGKYLIGGSLAFATNATGRRLMRILLNGTTVICQAELPLSSSESGGNLTTIYNLAAADYVELQAYQSSGGALNVIAGTNYSPEFWAMWMAT